MFFLLFENNGIVFNLKYYLRITRFYRKEEEEKQEGRHAAVACLMFQIIALVSENGIYINISFDRFGGWLFSRRVGLSRLLSGIFGDGSYQTPTGFLNFDTIKMPKEKH